MSDMTYNIFLRHLWDPNSFMQEIALYAAKSSNSSGLQVDIHTQLRNIEAGSLGRRLWAEFALVS